MALSRRGGLLGGRWNGGDEARLDVDDGVKSKLGGGAVKLTPVRLGRSAAGLLMVAALFVRWVESGSGSTMSGRRLAAALIELSLPVEWARLSGYAILMVGVLGVAVLCLSASGSRNASRTCFACSMLPLVTLLVLALTRKWPVDDWAAGPFVVLTGCGLGVGTCRDFISDSIRTARSSA